MSINVQDVAKLFLKNVKGDRTLVIRFRIGNRVRKLKILKISKNDISH